MGLGKQAKTLSKGQTEAVLAYLAKTRWPTRNRLIFLLSVKAGLRAKEIAHLTWWMTNDSQGEVGRAMPAGFGQQGKVRQDDPAERRSTGRSHPVSTGGELLRRQIRHQH